MGEIRYQIGCQGINWEELRQTLIRDEFDNLRTTRQYQISFENSAVVVLALDGDQVIGTVRALSDGVCNAYIVDVWTYTPYRRQGIARHMLQMTLDSLPGQHVYLFTDSAAGLYEKLGFRPQPQGMGMVAGEWLQNDTR
jgi:ribosomal protein S18 acetylase RimI-like enzyme